MQRFPCWGLTASLILPLAWGLSLFVTPAQAAPGHPRAHAATDPSADPAPSGSHRPAATQTPTAAVVSQRATNTMRTSTDVSATGVQLRLAEWGLVIQVLGILALVIYVWKTWEMASEMRRTREQEAAPYVTVFFDLPYGESLVYLVVKNVGKTVAENVRLAFEPQLCSNLAHGPVQWAVIDQGIPSLPPGYEIRTLYDGVIGRFSDKCELPPCYSVVVQYLGSPGRKPLTAKFVLDLSPFRGIQYTTRKDMHELVERMEQLVRSHQSAERGIRGIAKTLDAGLWVATPSRLDFHALLTTGLGRPVRQQSSMK